MRTVAVIQARIGSSRLPGKALRALSGRPMLAHVIERVLATAGVDEVLLATSLSEPDAALLAVAAQSGVRCWRGSEWDVLGRTAAASLWAKADVILRVTADCPFWDPAIGAQVLARHLASTSDYTSNDTRAGASGYPDGTDAECFWAGALAEAAGKANDRADREHVTSWMRDHLACGLVRSTEDLGRLKLSVDTMADYELATAIAERLGRGDFRLVATVAAAREVLGADSPRFGPTAGWRSA